MADLTHKILLEIRDSVRHNGERIDETNQRLTVLAQLTQGIDTRLEKIENREFERVFLPQRVAAFESRVDRLEAEQEA